MRVNIKKTTLVHITVNYRILKTKFLKALETKVSSKEKQQMTVD